MNHTRLKVSLFELNLLMWSPIRRLLAPPAETALKEDKSVGACGRLNPLLETMPEITKSGKLHRMDK